MSEPERLSLIAAVVIVVAYVLWWLFGAVWLY
jgi:hypothetical protein